ncbi:hypothetical protein COO59_19755 [Mixta theicola]|uniref:DnaJ homologue subfamily C member 28 conserved domain-containing protein n=1 Tax=Mixta theicola TaxID=1458355 RepID=A0A2K1Q4T5_9GAMM|nr:DUF1992 domain-containing protein [Mixta theicola]PNS10021.1 hypothetical protein COO59_19755 [Mixta theicola]GLR07897.1 hypothetical protein GCM10007905_06160 [Mixta theicola]
MWLIDQLAEQHIREAQQKGELEGLSGEGAPLILDDDSHVPAELRAGYRLLKNAGYLPPELEIRREALELNDLLKELDPPDKAHSDYLKRLRLLEIKLIQAGMNTDFLSGQYRDAIAHRFGE